MFCKYGPTNDLRTSKAFGIYQASIFLTLLGVQTARFVIAWWALDRTKSPEVFATLLALATTAEMLARLFLSWLGDVYEKRKLIFLCNIATGLSLGLLAWLMAQRDFNYSLVAVAMCVSAVALGVRNPVQLSLLPTLVQKERFSWAIQQRATISTAAMFSSPAIASWSLEFFDAKCGVLLAICLVAAGAVVMALVEANRVQKTSQTSTTSDGFLTQWYTQTWAGIEALVKVRVEFLLSILSMAINFSLAPFLSILLVASVKASGNPPWIFGMLEGLFNVGMLLGSIFIVPQLNERIGRYRAMCVGFSVLALPMLVVGLGPLAHTVFEIPVRTIYLLTAPLFLLAGSGVMLVNVNQSTVRSLATPASYRTRILGANTFLSGVSVPIGNACVGALLTSLSPATVCFVFGVMVAICVPGSFMIRGLRQIMETPDADLEGTYEKRYPTAFSAT